MDRPEQLRARADHDVVAHGRVALAAREARAAQRDPLVEGHVVADLGRLADHDAGPVVDEERFADPRRRVDLHAGQDTARVRQRVRETGTPASWSAWATRCESSACTPP